MSTIRVVNLQHTDATEPNIVLLADGTSVFASGITISGGTNLTVSGTAEFASGTVSAPGITFIDDNNTGLYSPATDTVAITTAATERVRVDSAGRLLVGTATEGAAIADNLTVEDSGHSGITIRSGTSSLGSLYFSDGTSGAAEYAGFVEYNHNGNYLGFGTGSTTRMRIDSSGNLLFSQSASSSYPEQKLKWSNDSTTTSGFYISQDSNRNGRIFHEQGLDILFGTNNAERMRIDSSGSVGIGVSNPSSGDGKLTVLADGTGAGTANTRLFMTGYEGTSGNAAGLWFGGRNNENTGVIGSRTGSGNIAFETFSGSWGERMRIDSSGNVGIGNTGPAQKLHVGGKIRFGANTTYYAEIEHDEGTTGANIYNSQDTGGHIFKNSGTEKLRIDNSGNVGIGTADPDDVGNFSRALDVSGASGASVLVRNNNSATNCGLFAYFGTSTYVMNRAAGPVLFYTSNTEKMRIDSSGNVLIGTTTLFGSGGITLTNAGAIVAPEVYGQVVSSSPRDVHVDSVGLFGYVSSIRESKANIRAQSNVDWLYQLEPVTFNYKSRNFKSGEYTGVESDVEYGLIAEDVESICPELCFYDKTNDGQKLSGIHYRKLITPMLKALQDANSKIKTLEQRLSDAGIA